MKAVVGSLLFIEDKNDAAKKRPYMCIYVFRNEAGVPYDWLIVPITSTDTASKKYLVPVGHVKLNMRSYAKISNIESISWNKKIEVAKKLFEPQYVKDVQEKLRNIFKQDDITDE